MPYEIEFDSFPAGYTLSAAQKGEQVTVQYTEFTSTEDGQHFIARLEGTPNEIVSILRRQGIELTPSSISHLLLIIRQDKTATVYINELEVASKVRVNRAIEQGETLYRDDVVDIISVQLGDVSVPCDAGVLFLFSIGWRKGLFYDYGPLPPFHYERQYDLEKTLGQCYAQVVYQELFALLESDWNLLFDAGWFPFTAIKQQSLELLIAMLREGWDLREVTNRIHEETVQQLERMLDSWKTHSLLRRHTEFLRTAINRYHDEDYISCATILYTRIEGILRGTHYQSSTEPADQESLSRSAVMTILGNSGSLLLPRKFQEFLRKVYFARFDPHQQRQTCNRNTVSHGVASVEEFSQKSSLVAILIVHQLFYCIPNVRPDGDENVRE